MSNSGPAPSWKRNAGFGCHESGPGDCIRASAVSGGPIAPSSTSRRTACSPAPRKVSGAPPTRASARSAASGFSFQTCLPAAIARSAISAWAAGIVRLTTISTSGWPTTTEASPATGTPCSAAFARATSGMASPTARTRVSGNCVRFWRYCELMFPAPMTPIPTGPVRAASAIGSQDELATRPDGLEQVSVRIIELDDPERRRRGREDRRDRDDARAGRDLPLRVERPVAVLDVERDDADAEPLQQRWDVG